MDSVSVPLRACVSTENALSVHVTQTVAVHSPKTPFRVFVPRAAKNGSVVDPNDGFGSNLVLPHPPQPTAGWVHPAYHEWHALEQCNTGKSILPPLCATLENLFRRSTSVLVALEQSCHRLATGVVISAQAGHPSHRTVFHAGQKDSYSTRLFHPTRHTKIPKKLSFKSGIQVSTLCCCPCMPNSIELSA